MMYQNWFQKFFILGVLTIAVGLLFSQKAIVGIGYGFGLISVFVFIWNLLFHLRSDSVFVEVDKLKEDKTD